MKVKVAVAQLGSVFFDKAACFEKVTKTCKIASENGCDLVVFPESFIPGYPRGFTFGANIGKRTDEGKAQYAEYYDNSVLLKGKDLGLLEEIARDNKCYIVVGVTEKVDENTSLYCSSVYISPTHGLLGVHRKIKPTGTERVVWAEADGESLIAIDSNIGKLGGLICWENYMPFARMSMYEKGVEIYIAPTADSREEWTATMIQIALEGRCYVIGCNQYFTKSMYGDRFRTMLEDEVEEMCRGGSVIVSPKGKIISGPIYDKEDLLIAELDLEEVKKAKMDFDVCGHYARNDIFTFSVNGQPQIIKEE